MNDDQWALLLGRIAAGKCTPFLGAGASTPTLPMGREIAREWARVHAYPLPDHHDDLARVAQYVGVGVFGDAVAPKERIVERLASHGVPDFSVSDEPHAVLAKLPIPIFITTNYDDFMVRALRAQNKEPRQEICRWNSHPAVQDRPRVVGDDCDYVPTVEEPLVFHLHGHVGVSESLVLTEDDYLDFLVAVSSERELLLPDPVRSAFAGTSLMFIGYSLADWDFRVLHRGLVMKGESALRRISVTVQLPQKDRKRRQAHEYLEKYFDQMSARVYWGNANEFVTELSSRWDARDAGG
jgi:hypothetical protein